MNNAATNTVENLTPPTARGSLPQYAPHIILFAVQFMFGSFAIIGKVALRELPSNGLVALRVGGAAIALWLLRAVIKDSDNHDKPTARDFPFLFLCALLGVVLNQFLFIKGLSLSTAINATLLGAAIPIWTLIVSFLLRRERVSKRKLLGCFVAISGVVYLVNPTGAAFSEASLLGDALLVLNTACYGTYLAVSQNIIKRLGALNVIVWVFTLAALICVPIGGYQLAYQDLSLVSNETWLAVLYIILFPSVAAYYLNAWALARVVPSTVAAYIYLQPVIAFILAPLVLNETINRRVWIATMLIFVGVAIVISRIGKTERPTSCPQTGNADALVRHERQSWERGRVVRHERESVTK